KGGYPPQEFGQGPAPMIARHVCMLARAPRRTSHRAPRSLVGAEARQRVCADLPCRLPQPTSRSRSAEVVLHPDIFLARAKIVTAGGANHARANMDGPT